MIRTPYTRLEHLQRRLVMMAQEQPGYRQKNWLNLVSVRYRKRGNYDDPK